MQYSTPIETAKSHNAMFAIAGMAGGKCSVVPIDGDNMEPTLFKGDAALTDTGIDEYQGEGLYVLDWFGVPTVYRLQSGRPGAGSILIKRDNPAYEATEMPCADVTELILGKVIALGRVIDPRGMQRISESTSLN